MRLRKHQFIGLLQLNEELRRLMHDVNNRKLQKLPGTRYSQFITLDKPALKPLPVIEYEFKHYKRGFIGNDYHVELFRHYYSVPYQYIRQYVDIWYNDRIVQIYLRNKLITSHARSINHGQTTLPEHMPNKHKKHIEWTEERCKIWAKSIGIATLHLVEQMLLSVHSENARRSCLGLMNLAKRYGNDRLEAACSYALQIGATSRKYLLAILDNNLDQIKLNETDNKSMPSHKNIRGGGYYA